MAGSGGIIPQGFTNDKPVHARHHHIQQNQIGRHRPGLFKGFNAIGGSANGKTRCLQTQAGNFKLIRIIFNYQYFPTHKSLSFAYFPSAKQQE